MTSFLVAAAFAVSAGAATASQVVINPPSPGGGGGATWTVPVVSTPCHAENGAGVCFVWSVQAEGNGGPWLLRLTDSTVVPPAPSGETSTPSSNVSIRLGNSWTSVQIGGQITVTLTSPGPYGVTEILEETVCSASGCGQSITSYAYSSVTTG